MKPYGRPIATLYLGSLICIGAGVVTAIIVRGGMPWHLIPFLVGLAGIEVSSFATARIEPEPEARLTSRNFTARRAWEARFVSLREVPRAVRLIRGR